MKPTVTNVTTRQSELAGVFGNETAKHGVLVATVLPNETEELSELYLDMDGDARSVEHVTQYDDKPIELSTSFVTIDWEPSDYVAVVGENDDGNEVFIEEITDRIATSFERARIRDVHKYGSVDERLDDLHQRLLDVEDWDTEE